MKDNLYEKIKEELINAPTGFSVNRERDDKDALTLEYPDGEKAKEKFEHFHQQSLTQILHNKINYQKK